MLSECQCSQRPRLKLSEFCSCPKRVFRGLWTWYVKSTLLCWYSLNWTRPIFIHLTKSFFWTLNPSFPYEIRDIKDSNQAEKISESCSRWSDLCNRSLFHSRKTLHCRKLELISFEVCLDLKYFLLNEFTHYRTIFS